ncbi:MAG: hypothetical protein QOC96_212 [Acidobacteriota bacterium]|jgi:hypothetical protein|nr:hypothetical protein [Acidobacteriota bacterium]
MAVTRAHSVPERESPQYASALAILSGGIAFIAPQFGAPVSTWLSCALLAALFGSIWPSQALQWAGWLCLPLLLMMCFDVISTKNLGGVLSSDGTLFVETLSSACLGAYVGSKLSVRKLAHRAAHRRVRKLRSNGNGARTGRAVKELNAPLKSVETSLSSQSASATAPAIEPVAHLHTRNAALIKAAQEGDLNGIRLLMADGADVNASSNEQWTPFTIAAEGFALETVNTLFGQSAALDSSVNQGWTALMIATIAGHLEVVRALVEKGAQVNALNHQGWTALRFAVSMDETEILHLLLDAGADANLPDHEGKTALMQAAGENIHDSLKMLLDAGADPHLKDHNQQTALMIAERQNHTEIIKLLKETDALLYAVRSEKERSRLATPV